MSEKIKQTEYVLPPPAVSSVAVAGTDARFPVRRIICVGRNYAAHAREMGRDPDREPPFFFLKPADTVVDNGATVPYPPETSNFHYEIELIVAIGKGGADIPGGRSIMSTVMPSASISLGATCSSRRASRGGRGTGARASTSPPQSRRCAGSRRSATRTRAASGSRWTAR